MDTELSDTHKSSRQSFKFAGRTHDFVDGEVVEVPKAPWGSFLFVVCLYYGAQWTEGDVALGFLRSIAVCPEPPPKMPGDVNQGSWPSTCLCPMGSYYTGNFSYNTTNIELYSYCPEVCLEEADSEHNILDVVWSTSTNLHGAWSPFKMAFAGAFLGLGDMQTQDVHDALMDPHTRPDPPPGQVVEGTCVAVPSGHEGWSMSERCMDQTFVVFAAYRVIGSIASFSLMGAMLSSLFFGATFIDSWGRKPMILISFTAQVLNCLCYCILVFSGSDLLSNFTWWFLTIGALFASCLNTFASAAGAMVVDGTPPDSNERSTRLVVFTVLRSVATIFNTISTFALLSLRLTSYATVWPIFGCVLGMQVLISAFLLIETKPNLPGAEKKKLSWCATSRREISAMFEICTSDRKLHTGIWCAAVGGAFFGVSLGMSPNWMILVLKLDAATSSLGGAYGAFFSVLGSGVSGPICIKWSQLKCLYLAQFLTIIGFGLIPLGPVLGESLGMPSLAGIFFWVGVGPFLAFGVGLSAPALFALLSSRVAPENQGKFFSGLGFVTLLLSTIFIYGWTQYLVNPESVTPIQDMSRGWIIADIAQIGVIMVTYAAFGCEYPLVTVGGSQLNFIEGVSGSRILAPAQFEGMDGVKVEGGGVHL